ncbi:hypothetical protein [Rosistilla oblonga]|uniref:hypothetical protein n=1 Tax=Rosistilla oblonga TaxID=2527990 RepID=UPI003A96DBEA
MATFTSWFAFNVGAVFLIYLVYKPSFPVVAGLLLLANLFNFKRLFYERYLDSLPPDQRREVIENNARRREENERSRRDDEAARESARRKAEDEANERQREAEEQRKIQDHISRL